MKNVFEIKGEFLKSSYSVYVIELITPDGDYYYIGQTGDNVHNTARSPFRRIAGHLSDIHSSTQNQLYRFLGKLALNKEINRSVSLTHEEKGIIEFYLIKCKIKFYSYPLFDFDFNQSMTVHKQKYQKIIEAEKYVIQLFETKKMELINKIRPNKNIEEKDFFKIIQKELQKDFNFN